MECLQLCQVVVLHAMFLNEFSTGKNQQKWWHMQQDLQTLRSMRCGGSCVSKCHGRSWPHTALCHADLGECWHVKTASIPSRKASFSCLCLTDVTSLAFLVQGHFENKLVSDFARKNEMSGTFQKIEANYAGFYGKYPLSCYHGQGVLQLSSIRFWKEIWRCWGTIQNCANLHRRLCQKNDTNFLPYRILAISTYQHYVTCSIFDGMPAVVPSCGFACYVFKWI